MITDYKKLLEQVGAENFKNRVNYLNESINRFLEEGDYPETVVCSERILEHVVLDYFSDIVRLKDFHGIEHTKTDKVVAYTVYWLLRRKPIQITQFSEKDRDIFINERFACNLLLAECLMSEDSNVVLEKENEQKLEDYIDLVLYYFKYRQLNAQVIELLIESFKIGKIFGA